MSAAETSLSGAFENLLTVTLGIKPVRDAAAGGDPTLRELPASVVRAVAAEMTTAEHGDPTDPIDTEAAEAMRAMDEFDRRLAAGAAEKAGGIATAPERKGGPAGPIDAAITAQPVRRKAPIGVTGLAWSPEAPELLREVEAERSRAGGAALHKFTSRAFLYGRFATLKLVNMRLSSIDERSRSLRGLRELNVSGNRLRSLANLPAELESLQAFGNRISEIRQEAPLSACVHLGLGYNDLASCRGVPAAFPALASLDLSWNRIESLDDVTLALAPLAGSLRRLELHGNPLCLLPGYRRAVRSALAPPAGVLALLDGLPVQAEASPGPSPAASPRAGSGVAISVRVLAVEGVPLPADVPGWREAREEAEAEAAAAAAQASKAKSKSKPKKGEADAAPEQPPAAPAAAPWRLRLVALPRAVADRASALPSPLQQGPPRGRGAGAPRATDQAGAGAGAGAADANAAAAAAAAAGTTMQATVGASSSPAGSESDDASDTGLPLLDAALGGDVPGPVVCLTGATSWQLRDALAVNGIDVTLIAERPASRADPSGTSADADADADADEAAGGGAAGPGVATAGAAKDAEAPTGTDGGASGGSGATPGAVESVVIGRALVAAAGLLEVGDSSDSASVVSRATLRIEQLPPTTRAAAAEAAEAEMKKELAEEAAEAAGGGQEEAGQRKGRGAAAAHGGAARGSSLQSSGCLQGALPRSQRDGGG